MQGGFSGGFFQCLFSHKPSRERNRVHARNTRERKKSLMDSLQSRIQQLVDEVGTRVRVRIFSCLLMLEMFCKGAFSGGLFHKCKGFFFFFFFF